MNSSHDDEADLRDREFPDETDLDEATESSVDLETCPYCGKAVYAQADICSHCRSFISFAIPPRRPLWIVITALVGILLVLTWVLLRWAPSFGSGVVPAVAEATTPPMSCQHMRNRTDSSSYPSDFLNACSIVSPLAYQVRA